MILSEVSDAVGYVARYARFKSTMLPVNCLTPDLTCAVHRLHRVISLALREDEVIGHCHAIGLGPHPPLPHCTDLDEVGILLLHVHG